MTILLMGGLLACTGKDQISSIATQPTGLNNLISNTPDPTTTNSGYTTTASAASGSIKQDDEVLYFPVERSLNKYSLLMAWQGKLIIEDGYIKCVDQYSGESRIVIWPPGYSLDLAHHSVQIMNKDKFVAQVGDNVILGDFGGQDYDVIELRNGQKLPANSLSSNRCWNAGSVEFSPFFPMHDKPLPEGDRFKSNLEGTLVVDRSYLRINTLSGVSYLPIWPAGLDVRKNNGKISMGNRDVEGLFYLDVKRFVFEKDPVIAQGAEVSFDELKAYAHYSLPEGWNGPFWLVTEIEYNDNFNN